MDPTQFDRPSHTPEPVSPPASSAGPSSSPSSPPGVLTWSAALVQLGALVAVIVSLPPTLAATFAGNPLGWKVLAGLGAVTLGVAAPTSLRDLLTLARRYLPGSGDRP
jgi:hypothetical protein